MSNLDLTVQNQDLATLDPTVVAYLEKIDKLHTK